MNHVLIFGGTTEGRRLAELLCRSGFFCTVCVATEYGEQAMQRHPNLFVHTGRMDAEGMKVLLSAPKFEAVVDATHPFAVEVSEHIRRSMEGIRIPYYRLTRERIKTAENQERVLRYENHQDCAQVLQNTEGNILLTTGSKELEPYCIYPKLRERLIVRVLPDAGGIGLCREQGLEGRQILAMQGPFSCALNEALIHQYQIQWMVTKESGVNGGFPEKLQAAEQTGIYIMMIGCPQESKGFTIEQVCQKLQEQTGCRISDTRAQEDLTGSLTAANENLKRFQAPVQEGKEKSLMHITLAGIGMGSRGLMTLEVQQALERADLILGAQRMLDVAASSAEKLPYYKAEDIAACLEKREAKYVVVLFSGDTGCYSGAQQVLERLKQEIVAGRLRAEVQVCPGISAVACLAARLGVSWQDAELQSIHGRQADIAEAVRKSEKTYLLVSGAADLRKIGEALMQAGLDEVTVYAGYELSYPQEQILKLTPAECRKIIREGLYTCMIQNPQAHEISGQESSLTPGIRDEAFLRGKAPMTKEEIREIAVCKLGLFPGAVLYDIGSGTGSVAVECARISNSIQVYAAEQKEEALSLIRQNCEKFQVSNVTLVPGKAPEVLEKLPSPTHAFIGGSGGKIGQILKLLYQKNSGMRVGITAITLETLSEVINLLKRYPIREESIVQVQVSRGRKAGSYRLMQAENPVWIFAFTFSGEKRA